MALHRLVFDGTDADTRAASAKVGAVLYDETNDRLAVINASNELLVHDADVLSELQGGIDVTIQNASISVTQGTSPWVIGDGGGSITVDATDLDIRDLSASQDNVAISDGTDTLAINADGSINITDNGGSLTVDATDLDIRDLSAATDSVESWTHDGTGNAIGSTGGSLNVNVTNAIDVDDGLANTAIKQVAETVGTSAALIVDGADELASRKYLFIYNNGNKIAYVGDSGVTTADGFPLPPGSLLEARIGDAVDVYMIADAAAQNIRTLQLS